MTDNRRPVLAVRINVQVRDGLSDDTVRDVTQVFHAVTTNIARSLRTAGLADDDVELNWTTHPGVDLGALLEASGALLDRLENMTTDAFSKGAEKPERDALRQVLGLRAL